MPYRNKNGAEKTFNAILPDASSERIRQGFQQVNPPASSPNQSGWDFNSGYIP
ncbi:Hypothetical protein EAG7_00286 [Klebsiella aerogenes]|nr:Hypothetical protein EAG7_00286 [Klebsiella aerogenes]CCG28906.1 hypothetical protein [Klebsiella aerogenes EA1509E]